ncbi:MAG: hypothetical protein ACD_79C00116G0002 [uncultured bacterium]|nr:MAG: hypothetical protein ACD_79C00116G0002 [uncultured bacterium]
MIYINNKTIKFLIKNISYILILTLLSNSFAWANAGNSNTMSNCLSPKSNFNDYIYGKNSETMGKIIRINNKIDNLNEEIKKLSNSKEQIFKDKNIYEWDIYGLRK